jgi:hypothetical protein
MPADCCVAILMPPRQPPEHLAAFRSHAGGSQVRGVAVSPVTDDRCSLQARSASPQLFRIHE